MPQKFVTIIQLKIRLLYLNWKVDIFTRQGSLPGAFRQACAEHKSHGRCGTGTVRWSINLLNHLQVKKTFSFFCQNNDLNITLSESSSAHTTFILLTIYIQHNPSINHNFLKLSQLCCSANSDVAHTTHITTTVCIHVYITDEYSGCFVQCQWTIWLSCMSIFYYDVLLL